MKDVTQIDPVALRTLATAIRLGTFEATARELHVTPSAVSQRIKALETHVGRVLVHRVKPLAATEAGQVLVRLAAQTELLEREAVAELLEGEEPGDDDPFVAVPIAIWPAAKGSTKLSPRRRTQRGPKMSERVGMTKSGPHPCCS